MATKPYEDAEEKLNMAKANPKALEQLNRFIGELATMKCETALEVACGAAHCTKAVLSKKFCKIDLFDESQGAVTDALKNLEGVERVGQVATSRMQDYTFDEKYNCILLRYCVGYLTDDELVQFI